MRDEKLEVIQSLRPIEGEAVDAQVVRAQYAAGFEMGTPVPGYREEPGVAPASRTETFVALQVFIDNWRWAGVPFFLRTGKRLPEARQRDLDSPESGAADSVQRESGRARSSRTC